jgi:membrane-associated protease RseP (regulator of RpoE activity)
MRKRRAWDLSTYRNWLAAIAAAVAALVAPASAQAPAQPAAAAPAHAFLPLGTTQGELSGRVFCYFLQTAPGQHWDIRVTGNFDTYLTIGRGTECGNIRADLRNDDSDGTLAARLRFTAAGGAYLVRVSAYMGGRGQFQVHVRPGVGDGARLQPGFTIAGAPPPLSQAGAALATNNAPGGGADPDKVPTQDGAPSTPARSWLGVSVSSFSAEMAEALGLAAPGGALVRSVVRGSPADNAGLRRDDVILSIDGTPTTTSEALTSHIAAQPAGTRSILEVSRDGAVGRVLVSLAPPPAAQTQEATRAVVRSTFAQGGAAPSAPLQFAGMSVVSVVPSQVTFGTDTDTVGSVIDQVTPGSPAATIGLARGDVIVRVNNGAVSSLGELAQRLRQAALQGRRNVLLSVLRGDQIAAVALPIQGDSTLLAAAPAADAASNLPSASFAAAPAPAAPIFAPSAPASARRFALVIGNSMYGPGLGSLPNPSGDADLIASSLRAVGFDVEVLKNADQRSMRRAISRLGERLSAAGAGSTGLFFFAGHGIASRGTNYLIPVNAEIEREADLEIEGVPADAVLAQMEEARSATNIIILDACRNMPLARSFRDGTRGLARMDAPRGSFIAYSTAPGSTAADGSGTNSPFALALSQRIAQPREPIEVTFREVRRAVLRDTNGVQTPWDSSSLVEPFTFRP